jgi:protein-histidine pros-kinase
MTEPMKLLREHEEELDYERLFENAADALILIGAGGEIQYVNSHAELLFGYSSKELIGEAVETLVPERYRARHIFHRAAYALEPRLREMAPYTEHVAGRRKDGAEFPAAVNLAPLPEGLTVAAIRKREDARQVPPKRKRSVSREVLVVLGVQLILNAVLYFLLASPG